jgi:glycosyltransferase involved in cell wall biosynthesis
MAMQKTVIASNVGGHRELISDGETGLLYEAGSRPALTQTLTMVARDPDLRIRIAAAGRRYVQEHRQWDRVIAGDLAAYERVLRLRRAGGLRTS